MSRSIWKGLHIANTLLKARVKKGVLKIRSRNSAIPASLIGKTVLVYTGRTFQKVIITRDKVGFKFGEFALTRVYYRKKLNLKSKQRIKKK